MTTTIAKSVPNGHTATAKRSYAATSTVLDVPDLIQVQLDSFNWFKTRGLREIFDEISPIEDAPGTRFDLSFGEHYFDAPKYTEQECREKEVSYSAPLYVTVTLEIKASGASHGEIKEQTLFVGDIPMMTSNGTFIINGAERVVVSQLVRSPGVYFTATPDTNTGRVLASAKLIPYRGAWMEFETSNRDVISAKVDRKRKTPISTLLRAMGYGTNEEILSLFEDVDTNENHEYIRTTIERDTAVVTEEDALLEFYRRLRPGEPTSLDNARNLIENLFYNDRRYDLGRVGRYKLNRSLNREAPDTLRTLEREDIITLIKMMIRINNGEVQPDDIDHLGNRRVRAVGELIQNQVRVGLLRMERVIKERMSTQIDPATTTPAALINIRPVVAAVREFFGGSQLSQFMDQTNPLAELTHKRRLSALGPGGLSRERAGFDVRDVHHSHYGRICPIETPEGPNIGLLGSLATYAKTNDFGFIETPYRRVRTEIANTDPDIVGRTLCQDIMSSGGGRLLTEGKVVGSRYFNRVSSLPEQMIQVKPYVSARAEDVEYLAADREEGVHIAQASAAIDEKGQFIDERIETRYGEGVGMERPEDIGFMDVSPMQLVSVSTALIPFLEHDDANRALMGSNMQRQAVPLLRPESPLVGTGMESRVARDSGQVVIAAADGVITEATGEAIIIAGFDGKNHTHKLQKFVRSNQGTCINQRSIVSKGDVVTKGQILADSSSTEQGELALGQNVLVAFMSWEGYNFEDAIILSRKLVKDDKFTSIHIEKHEVEARDTKLGPEEITRDIPNVGEDSLFDLDEDGIIRVGAEIKTGDILVGKITPKGETELSAEEKLLRAIFGEKARDVKDTSLRVPHGERGKVIGVKVLDRSKDDLSPGVNKMVRLWIAQTRKITEGDKMAGRHGNKGVVAKILPEEDMPFLPDGTPVDIILNPIGVPSRMNLGQVLETHLGWAAHNRGFEQMSCEKAITPVFDGASDTAIEDALARAWIIDKAEAADVASIGDSGLKRIDMQKVRNWLEERNFDHDIVFDESSPGEASRACIEVWLREDVEGKHLSKDVSEMSLDDMRMEVRRLNREEQIAAPTLGKSVLYDGRTGERFDQPIAVGFIYMMKLIHLVEDKIHARSTGPYSLITQQPLGGKAQFGGQRFGEMEVWALEAYSAANNLQEMLTLKSDDTIGRVKTYEAIVKGENVSQPGVPESFHVLMKELQSLGMSIELMKDTPDDLLSDMEDFDGFDDDLTTLPEYTSAIDSINSMFDDAPNAADTGSASVVDVIPAVNGSASNTDDASPSIVVGSSDANTSAAGDMPTAAIDGGDANTAAVDGGDAPTAAVDDSGENDTSAKDAPAE